jgi:RHS repeat-associated protein
MTYGPGHTSGTAGALVPGTLARYLPFGDWRALPTADSTDIGFTGHKANNVGSNDIGLIYMNARFYVGSIGRFASADTIVPDPTNPQSYNRYAYGYNNPLRFTDPTGHCVVEDDLGGQCTPMPPLSPPPPTPIWTHSLLDSVEAVQYYGNTVWSEGEYRNTNLGQHPGLDYTMFGTSFGGREMLETEDPNDWDYSRYGTEEFPLIPVYAGCDCILHSTEASGGGYVPGLVTLKSNNEEYSDFLLYYGHLRDIQVTSETGTVTPDTIIGYLDTSQFHVHLEIRRMSDNYFVNPFPYLSPDLQAEMLSFQGISYESTTTYQEGYPDNPAVQPTGYYLR